MESDATEMEGFGRRTSLRLVAGAVDGMTLTLYASRASSWAEMLGRFSVESPVPSSGKIQSVGVDS